MPYIDIRDLTVAYGPMVAVSQFSLQGERDDRVVILGPSGSGKTTLLLAICGLLSHQNGDISLNGRRIDHLPPGKRKVAMVFQDGALFPHLTARQNIELPLRAAKVVQSECSSRVRRIAEMVGVEPLLDRRPSAMSGGERQRVAIARALVREPDLYVLDEPFASLDPLLRHRMAQEVLEIHLRLGVPFIHVTHDQSEALSLGTRIVVLCEGHIRQIGTPAEIYDAPADLFVAGFVGFPPMNLLPIERVPADLAKECHDLPRTPSAGSVVVGFRPEDVHVEPGGPARLLNRHVQGHEQIMVFQWDTVRLTARMKRGKSLDSESYGLSLPHGRLHYFDHMTGKRL
ncbi:MAG: ABC transporter ATP-binding protein [Candidatus Eisenbacteria bacterium]|nr:ABC transporter ATP-binding protein [Candidatus Eisenbacteria bacterium]